MAAESRAAGGRPRRTTRAPIKAPLAVTEGEPSNSPGKGKAQAPEKSAGDKLESLLTNPRSKLTKIDISVRPCSSSPAGLRPHATCATHAPTRVGRAQLRELPRPLP